MTPAEVWWPGRWPGELNCGGKNSGSSWKLSQGSRVGLRTGCRACIFCIKKRSQPYAVPEKNCAVVHISPNCPDRQHYSQIYCLARGSFVRCRGRTGTPLFCESLIQVVPFLISADTINLSVSRQGLAADLRAASRSKTGERLITLKPASSAGTGPRPSCIR